MSKHEHLVTLKDAVIYTNHAEENIRLQISRGLLKKYDKHGTLLKDPLRKKGFFKLSELMSVYDIHEDPEDVKKKFLIRKQKSDSAKNIITKEIHVLHSSEMDKLNQIETDSIDTWILAPKFDPSEKLEAVTFKETNNSPIKIQVKKYLQETHRILKPLGNILIHSIPRYLPYFGVILSEMGLFFKYWIVYAAKTPRQQEIRKFTPEVNGILYFVKSKRKFRINRVREPYRNCSFCSEPLKDYGGKKHLRHVDGMVISDIWHLEYDSGSNLPSLILKRLIDLSCNTESSLLLAPFDGEIPHELRE